MEKFSVVIPTIWKSEYIHQLLLKYYACDAVQEVILINNNRENTPIFPKHPKLVYVEPFENLYVNPSWNMGVRLAKSNNVIISNDDILFDINLYANFLLQVNKNYKKFEEIGLIGTHMDNYSLKESDKNIKLSQHQRTMGWACLFTFNKKNWKPIPDQLKIYYGDDFLKLTCWPVYDMIGIKIETKMSTSADTAVDWVKAVTDNDKIEWEKLLQQF
jgi:hypothetical protein